MITMRVGERKETDNLVRKTDIKDQRKEGKVDKERTSGTLRYERNIES